MAMAARGRRAARAVMLAALAAAAVALLTLRGWTWSSDIGIYDRLLPLVAPPADPSIVLVMVDEPSLSTLGRWPWSRALHARLLDRITPAKPRGIALDMQFSERDQQDPGGDALLAEAMRRSGRVVSPLAAEAAKPGLPPTEVLPLPELVAASAALGHVEIDADPDGVTRHAYLHAGLGSARWPALALALRDLDPRLGKGSPLPGQRNPDTDNPLSPFMWVRDYRVMVPFARANRFEQVSYADVLNGEVAPNLFRDRWVLVGVGASGIRREVLVPEHGGSHRISGTEYHAHLLNALLGDGFITPLAMPWQLTLGIAFALLPIALRRTRVREWHPVAAPALAAIATFAACVLLLYIARLWFAPVPALTVIVIGAVALLLGGLSSSQRQANFDGLTRLGNRHLFDTTLARETAAARRSGEPVSLLLIDIDHFKQFNDNYGHQAGDELLRKVADAILLRARRPRDLAARYGGDEMALILPGSTLAGATEIAESIVAALRDQRIPHAHSQAADHASLSIGVACFDPQRDKNEAGLLQRTDAALYQAKHEGRNRASAQA